MDITSASSINSASVRGTMPSNAAAAAGGRAPSTGSKVGGFFKKLAVGIGKTALGVASAVVPGAGVLANALGGAFGNNLAGSGGIGSAAGMSASGDSMVSEMAAMNMQFMALQNAVQNESRKYQTVSNASRARHDIAMNAIRNMKA